MQRFLKLILPSTWFAALREGTRQWLVECGCGYKRDLWDLGGIRYKAKGTPRTLARCPKCHERTLHTIRRKQPGELGDSGCGDA